MGYYMRFIVDDDRDISLDLLESALKEIDLTYAIVRDEKDDNAGDITYNGDIYGQIEINSSGDGLFDEELEELKENVEDAEGEKKSKVLDVLRRANIIIAVRVLWQGRDPEATLERIDPLWEWLFANRKGLLQAGGEGYYDETGVLILEVE